MCQVNIDAMGEMQLALAVAVEPEQDQATAMRGQEKAKLHGPKESHTGMDTGNQEIAATERDSQTVC